ncbi:hypothetical protein [Burkholderia gladioli]|uniref:hypothetical protein n=1 Tax=Burkholderia gladioli TaxID=28095 RepID=UPI00163EB256|nr:hypothetical protein [Burkholderia gladioli]MBJ9675242.1 hypothetical protein [Burkholderia gladioli]MDN7463494.1 hypothetical protein [Burkholderia gladioli]
MRQALARPEQTNSQAVDPAAKLGSESSRNSANSQSSAVAIINRALRDAALAPTYQDALDVTGGALRLLVELARAEVSHG